MKITKHRKEILDTLANHHGTMSASDIRVLLPHINLVTIYRNLEAFAEQGMIKKLFLGTNEAVFEFQQHPHHHAICSQCDTVYHFTANQDELVHALQLKNFAINDVEVIVRGTCNHTHS